MKLKVYYEDTDAGGVVYYANYLKYAERGRTEFFHDLGFSNTHFIEKNVFFVVRRCVVDYMKPAKLEDDLTLETKVLSISGASMEFLQTLKRRNELLTSMDVQVVAMTKEGRPTRVPLELKEKIKL